MGRDHALSCFALITGLEIALDIEISTLKVFGDSQLVIRQMNGIYEVTRLLANLVTSWVFELVFLFFEFDQ